MAAEYFEQPVGGSKWKPTRKAQDRLNQPPEYDDLLN